jgi:electron transfer flavoprotein alpha/beta subunit
LTIQQKLEGMKEVSIKGIATKDTNNFNNFNEPRYPQNKIYRKAYTEGLTKQEDTIKKRIAELDAIISSTTTKKVERKRSEAEKIVKENDLTKIETLYNKLKQEKKRIKDLLK